ncbi:MAG: DUF2474 domain-containing protein [Pseudomonadota bacterium]|nr:DUF2474 domain-containing protein [Pseudomonadota bacterium]
MATTEGEDGRDRPLKEKLLWFAGLWLGGLIAVAAAAYALKALLGP